MEDKDKKVLYITLVISVLIHLIGLLLISGFNLLASSAEAPEEPAVPLELEFEQPNPPVQAQEEQAIPEKFYEIVENPNATEDQPQETDMLSTAASRSQAPEIIPGQLRAVPGSETEGKTVSEASEPEQVQEEKVQEAFEKSLLAYQENRNFSRSALTGKQEPPKMDATAEPGQSRGETSNRPEGFDADLVGDFALSTYEWEWAPYWLAFKRKLNRVWYAPPAYYELGLIHGHTILRFKINREGYISDLQVLRQVGHSSLEQSSVSAIQAVFPFLPLPSTFPDEYLEVTVKMIYPNLREYNLSQSNE
jgi:outer membrane biosynthesis protein TonB